MKEHLKRSTNKAKSTVRDEYRRYCNTEPVDEDGCGFSGHLEWWKAHEPHYPRLAQMGRDIFSVPGMSAEVESLFSSSKLMIPDHRNRLKPDFIEAGECIRSWAMGGLVLGDYFEYLPAYQKAGEKFGDQGNP